MCYLMRDVVRWLLPVCPMIFLLFRSSTASGRACPYYGKERMSKAVGNLANCSWFGQEACCERTEVTSVFSDMFKLYGASKDCEDRLSYLMCYFCSPEQGNWYNIENNKARICRSFCEATYEACADAYYEDQQIKSIFHDKTVTMDGGFCKDNYFDWVDGVKDCYNFDATPFSRTVPMRSSSLSLALAMIVFWCGLFREISL